MNTVIKRPRGRPVSDHNKQHVNVRVDKDVIALFRASGPGWTTRMSDVLTNYMTQRHPEVFKERQEGGAVDRP